MNLCVIWQYKIKYFYCCHDKQKDRQSFNSNKSLSWSTVFYWFIGLFCTPTGCSNVMLKSVLSCYASEGAAMAFRVETKGLPPWPVDHGWSTPGQAPHCCPGADVVGSPLFRVPPHCVLCVFDWGKCRNPNFPHRIKSTFKFILDLVNPEWTKLTTLYLAKCIAIMSFTFYIYIMSKYFTFVACNFGSVIWQSHKLNYFQKYLLQI